MADLTVRMRRHRRGVVLILILGMLALMALVGLTFAMLGGQARVNARNFAERLKLPDAALLMDFALDQLINDTGNPMSALRGHSLKRDMYGNDAVSNGFLAELPDHTPLVLLAARPDPSPAFAGFTQFLTNIPVGGQPGLIGLDCSRWILTIAASAGLDAQHNPRAAAGPAVAQTLEVLRDDNTGSDPFSQGLWHLLTLSNPDTATAIASRSSRLVQPAMGSPFLLDGRSLRAFNGPGMTAWAGYANFRWNGTLLPAPSGPSRTSDLGNPDAVGMDEDYDACDLENWFLAIQSADGPAILPSFHRPGILTANDWTSPDVASRAKILRPRPVDHPSSPFLPLLPDPVTGRLTYDVDNDGDGLTDAVWLDLGFPVRRDRNGRYFK